MEKSQIIQYEFPRGGSGGPWDCLLRPFPGKSNVPDKICTCGNLGVTPKRGYTETSLFPYYHFIPNGDRNLAFQLETIRIWI